MAKKKNIVPIDELLAEHGEDALRDAILATGRMQLMLAVEMLHTQKWWLQKLENAFKSPKSPMGVLLTRIIDKLLPNAGTLKPVSEQADTFLVTYELPHEEIHQAPSNPQQNTL